MIRIWRAYSCNNSSSYRLVARFGDATTAAAVADELTAFLAEHAKQIDLQPANVEQTAAGNALATKYGFTWSEPVYWSTGGLAGDEPDVVAIDNVLAVYHGYCGGLDTLAPYLEARGGAVDGDYDSDVIVSLLFKHPGGAELTEDLAKMTELIDDQFDAADLIPPWSDHAVSARCVVFHDARTVGIYLPVQTSELDRLRNWLAEHGVTSYSIKLCEDADFHAFAKAATARCTACHGVLEYLDPRIDDIEKPQLVCKPCGGFYDLEAFP